MGISAFMSCNTGGIVEYIMNIYWSYLIQYFVNNSMTLMPFN